MIFFTGGTEQFAFQRMLDAADLVAQALPEEEVFIQIADNPQTPQHATWDRWLTFPEFEQRIEQARIVITHAGAGSLLACAWRNKVAITVPRLFVYGEHVDNHQIELAEKMASLGHAIIGETPEELCQLVLDYDQQVQRISQQGHSQPNLDAALSDWLAQTID
ncbi:MAG: hypothetical protein MK213_07515 [Planctomycetes bacterium]|nr:hypothetical protein [Planctomycetota bacterium]